MDTIRKIFRLLGRNKRHVYVTILLAWLSALIADFGMPLVYAHVTNLITSKTVAMTLAIAAGGYILLSLIRLGVWRSMLFALIHAEIKNMKMLSQHTAEHILGLSLDFFKGKDIGDLVSKHFKFPRSYESLHDTTVFAIISSVNSICILLPYMMYRMPIFGFAITFAGSLFAIYVYRKARKQQELYDEATEYEDKLNGIFSDQISNISVIHSYGRLEHEKRRYMHHNRVFYEKKAKVWWNNTWLQTTIELFQWFLVSSAIGLSIYYIEIGVYKIGDFVVTLSFVTTIASKITAIGNVLKNIKQAIADAEQMFDVLDVSPITTDSGELELSQDIEKIEFRNVSYQYPGTDKKVFDKLNLVIQQGQKIGIVGPSGSGKSTLINLLLRHDDPSEGGIYINGKDIREYTLESLRNCVSSVPQEPGLFHQSIKRNILYPRPDASAEELGEAIKNANLTDVIASLSSEDKDGVDVNVGQNGGKLSGGQKQRIAIARAMIAARPIWILDEATSALDGISENLIKQAMETVSQDYTLLCIAHRLSTVKDMDRIIVLSHGKIIEDGTHESLMMKSGIYTEMVNAQRI